MIKGKKGANTLRDFGTILILIVAVGSIFLSMYTKTNSAARDFGSIQKTIMDSYSNVELTFFAIDRPSKYSAQQAAYDLAQKGGFIEENGCGDNFGFAIWQAIDEEGNLVRCFPDQEKINDSYKILFLSNLNEHLENYNEISDITIPLDNYEEIELRNKLEVIGIAKENIEIPIK